jgi:hypothetical protein
MKREYNSDEHKHGENEKLAEIADLTHFHSNIPAAQFGACVTPGECRDPYTSNSV